MRKNYRRPFYLSQFKFEPFVKPLPQSCADLTLIEQVRAAISRLDPIDAQIVRGHWGIEAMAESLNALGKQLGISKQAAQKREKRAMTRLQEMLQPLMT